MQAEIGKASAQFNFIYFLRTVKITFAYFIA